MHEVTSLALCFYLGTLAITQTAYGGQFMTTRWGALSLLFIIASLQWYYSRLHRYPATKGSTTMILIYLSMTFSSVLAAENPLFSWLKWASHAAMILVFLVFLRQSLKLKQTGQVLILLKWLVAILIFLSWLNPISSIWSGDIRLFRGAFGSPNSMGQVAAVGGLLFLHSFLIGKTNWLPKAEIIMACAAGWLVWLSGARSAMVACIIGLILLNYFYRSELKTKVFWTIILVAGIALAVPSMPKAVMSFVLRGDTERTTFSEQIFRTRASVWAGAWEGFKKRPLLGWGFGADDSISKHWEPKLTALGIVTRDSVNDTLIILESTGIVGLMAYILLILFAVKQTPTRHQRFLIRQMHGPPLPQGRGNFSAYHVHAIAFIISMSLLVTVQFDNTALSAGNFVSVTLWLCVALAGAVKNKAVLYESAMERYEQFSKMAQQPCNEEPAPVVCCER